MILNEQNGYNFVKDIISDLSTMFDDVVKIMENTHNDSRKKYSLVLAELLHKYG